MITSETQVQSFHKKLKFTSNTFTDRAFTRHSKNRVDPDTQSPDQTQRGNMEQSK